MADKKISELTAAALPLAGTEVLPIVQSGATVKVASDDLTVKNVRSNATTGILQIAGPGAGETRTMTTPNANFTAARTDAAQSFTGDQTLSTGNLIQGTATKGFNFTANTPTAGMTSRLLNWYEEGIWTATLSDGTNSATMGISTCAYTRIGRQVTVSGLISTTSLGSVTGAIRIAGLPFTVGNGNSYFAGGGIAYGDNLAITAGQSVSLLIQNNSTHMNLRVWSATTGNVAMTAAQWTATGAAAFSVTYFV